MKINNPQYNFKQFKREVNNWVQKEGGWDYLDWTQEKEKFNRITQKELINDSNGIVIDYFYWAWREKLHDPEISVTKVLDDLFDQ